VASRGGQEFVKGLSCDIATAAISSVSGLRA
jgi:hypothetical protein